jgi:predicted transcriptional regulator
MRQLVDQFFESSPELLVQNLLEDERLDASELERLRRMVAEHD